MHNPHTLLSSRVTSALVVATTSIGLGTAPALAVGGVKIQFNDGSPVVLEQSVADSESIYTGSYADPGGKWNVEWSYTVDHDPSEVGSVVGWAKFTNTSGKDASFSFDVEVPICPIILNESLMGASLKVTLIAGPDGASMTSKGEESVFTAFADSDPAGTIFASPFLFGGGGGVMSTNGNFGVPYPSHVAPPAHEDVGMSLQFVLGDGNVATLASSLYFAADPDNLGECTSSGVLGDLTGNGLVGVADLLVMLGSWGPCSGCKADLNGDGVVGVADLLILVSNWSK